MHGGKIMEINIISDKTNAALKRRDVSIRVKSEITPSRVDVKNKLAAMLNSKPELIVIDKLSSVFGKQEAVGKVGIYEDEEHLKNVVLGHLAKRDKVPPPEEEPGAEAAEGKAE
jgi:small subunit ribosomal protein S24e